MVHPLFSKMKEAFSGIGGFFRNRRLFQE